MSTSATIFGSFPTPAAQRATAADASTAVAPMFESYARDGAPLAASASGPTDVGSSVTASIFESYSNHSAVVLAAEPGPVATAIGAWVTRIRQAFNRWTKSYAQSRADARLWDIACSDPRIMDELMQAMVRDDSETLGEPVVMVTVAEQPLKAKPAARQRAAGLNWGRILEDAYQHRFHEARHRAA